MTPDELESRLSEAEAVLSEIKEMAGRNFVPLATFDSPSGFGAIYSRAVAYFATYREVKP